MPKIATSMIMDEYNHLNSIFLIELYMINIHNISFALLLLFELDYFI